MCRSPGYQRPRQRASLLCPDLLIYPLFERCDTADMIKSGLMCQSPTLSGRGVTGSSAWGHGLQENAGNDPNTQIVPSGSGTSWQKVEEASPAPADPKTALTAGSTWASTQSKDSGWQPPAPAISSLPPPRPGSRRLNPHEYPSLSAAASGRQQSLPKQRVPVVPDAQVMHQSLPRSCMYLKAFVWHGWRGFTVGKARSVVVQSLI